MRLDTVSVFAVERDAPRWILSLGNGAFAVSLSRTQYVLGTPHGYDVYSVPSGKIFVAEGGKWLKDRMWAAWGKIGEEIVALVVDGDRVVAESALRIPKECYFLPDNAFVFQEKVFVSGCFVSPREKYSLAAIEIGETEFSPETVRFSGVVFSGSIMYVDNVRKEPIYLERTDEGCFLCVCEMSGNSVQVRKKIGTGNICTVASVSPDLKYLFALYTDGANGREHSIWAIGGPKVAVLGNLTVCWCGNWAIGYDAFSPNYLLINLTAGKTQKGELSGGYLYGIFEDAEERATVLFLFRAEDRDLLAIVPTSLTDLVGLCQSRFCFPIPHDH